MVAWSCPLGPVVRQNNMMGNTKAAHGMVARGSKERKDQVPNIPFKGTSPMAYFL
jgi:hypothetical protein